MWIGPLLMPFGYLGVIDRWLGVAVFGAAVGVTLFGVRRTFALRRPVWRRTGAVVVFGIGLLAGLRFAANNFGADVTAYDVEVDGRQRTYLVHVPPALEQNEEVPAVLALHGLMQSGRSFARLTGLNRLADNEGFVAVYPEGVLRSWNDGDDSKFATKKDINDLAFIRALLKRLSDTAPVDDSRIYAVGFSNGGFLLARHACELANELAAVGFVGSGVYPLWNDDCSAARALPAMFANGTDDPMLRPVNERFDASPARSGRLWAESAGCGSGPVRETLTDGGDGDATSVVQSSYTSCQDSVRIVQLSVEGGGHVWPGGRKYLPPFMVGKYTTDLDATQALWAYLSRYSID